jgi:hypothetical protein
MRKIGGNKPGTALIRAGITTFAIAGLFVLLQLGRTEKEVVYNDFTGWGTVERWVGPAPLLVAVMIVGAVLAGIGYARRHLAAVEAR